MLGKEATNISQGGNETRAWKTPADEYFHNKILEMSEGIEHPGTIVWQLLLCDIASWVIVFLCIMRGVKSVGKVVYFTTTFPLVIMFVMFVRGVTLPGAWDGIRFYLMPKWEQLGQIKVWTDAAVQVFYSLGPGWGGIVNMASYNQFNNDNKLDSIVLPLVDGGTSIFAGFVVFSVLGYMSYKTGVPVPSVATGGPGLAFVTYPEAIAMLPIPQLWAVLFFIMMYLLGVNSLFVQIEALISSVSDEYTKLRKYKILVTAGVCFSMFLVTLTCVTNGGVYVVQLLDWYAASIAVILICIIECLIIGWIYGSANFICDMEFMIGKKVNLWWKLCWKYITPGILIFMFVTSITFSTPAIYNDVPYPGWAIAMGWFSAVISMIWIPVYIIYKLVTTKGSFTQRWKVNLQPSKNWCPASEEVRIKWEEHRLKCNQR